MCIEMKKYIHIKKETFAKNILRYLIKNKFNYHESIL